MFLAFSFFGGHLISAQQSASFTSLNQPAFAKIAGLGGMNASLYHNGSSFYLYNPALLNDNEVEHLSLSYAILPGSAGLSNANYTFNINQLGVFGAAIQYLSYGTIQGYDNTGATIGTFTPNDFTINITHARQVNNFRLGASIKFSNTSIAGYSGNAILFDIGGVFIHPEKDFTVGMVLKNMGFVTNEFSSTSNTTLPFDAQIGTTVKPEHMPIRFSVTMHHLQEWNLMHADEEINSFNSSLDNVFRHIVLGAEIILNKNISVLSGYNHLRRQDLKFETSGGFSGFSIGTSISLNAFQLVYAFGGYNPAGNNNNFTLAANISAITFKKNNTNE